MNYTEQFEKENTEELKRIGFDPHARECLFSQWLESRLKEAEKEWSMRHLKDTEQIALLQSDKAELLQSLEDAVMQVAWPTDDLDELIQKHQ